MTKEDINGISNLSFDKAVQISKLLEKDLYNNPTKYRVLTGDRPT